MLRIAINTGTRMYVFTKTLVKNILKEKKTTVSIKSIHDLEYSFSDKMLWLDIKVDIVSQKYLGRTVVLEKKMLTHDEQRPRRHTTVVGPTNLKKNLMINAQIAKKISALKHQFGN